MTYKGRIDLVQLVAVVEQSEDDDMPIEVTVQIEPEMILCSVGCPDGKHYGQSVAVEMVGV